MMTRLPILVLAIAVIGCHGREPHAVLDIEDTLNLASDATGLAVGTDPNALTLFNRDNHAFPLTMLVTSDHERHGVGLWIEARRDKGLAIARGHTIADFTSDGTTAFRVSLGYACEAVSRAGLPCATADAADLNGVCVAGACVPSQCGDGVVSGSEQCDDGNTNNNDSCTNACATNVCGDGFVDPLHEQCDDGNKSDADGCLATCLSNQCGDTIVDPAHEDCDDGNKNPNDGCNNDCKTTTWAASILAGAGIPDTLTDGAAATGMALGEIAQLASSADGTTVLFSDSALARVFRYDVPSATISSVFGSDGSSPGSLATTITLAMPNGVAIDADGNIYVADAAAFVVRKVDATTGRASVIGGNGTSGDSGDYGPGTAAQLEQPMGVAISSAGDVYIADAGSHRIRKIDANSGEITPVAGVGVCSDAGNNGPAILAGLCGPVDLATAGDGSVYVVESTRHRVRRIDPTGALRQFAGTGTAGSDGDGGQAAAAELFSPSGVAIDTSGNVYIADTGNARIRRVDSSRIITTFSGNTAGFSGDGGAASAALLNQPTGVTVSGSALYIGDTGNRRVRKVDLVSGTITTVAGAQTFDYLDTPVAKADIMLEDVGALEHAPDDAIWVALPTLNRVVRIGPDGSAAVVAGAGDVHGHGDFGGDGGPASAALLSAPSDIAFDGTGKVYIADTGNNRIRAIDASGVISTIAGGDIAGSDGDTGPATDAHLSAPVALAVGTAGKLYIADSGNLKVRLIDAGGIITTAAGGSFASVGDLLALNDTSLLIADATGHTVWKLSGGSVSKAFSAALDVRHMASADGTSSQTLLTAADGKIYQNAAAPTPFAGTRAAAGATGLMVRGIGRAATEGWFIAPQGVTVDDAGDVFVGDGGRIFRIESGSQTLGYDAGRRDGAGPFALAALRAPRAIQPVGALLLVAQDVAAGVVECADTANQRIAPCVGDAEGYPAELTGFAAATTTRALAHPQGFAYDAAGQNLYVSESASNVIRRVHLGDPADPTTWSFEAYAGSGTAGSGDGAIGTATFRSPSALAYSIITQTLYVADTGNHTIRAIDTVGGSVSTYAGIAGLLGFSGDGGDARDSLLRTPSGVALASDGRSLYIADTDNHRVRYVDDAGTIRTVTGTGLAVTSGSGVQAGAATMAGPVGLAVDNDGNLFIAGRAAVRIVAAGGDGLALANDTTQLVYGVTDAFPDRVTDCLAGMTLDATQSHAYVVDACRGYVIDLARQ